MADHTEVLDRLDRYAKACARNVLAKFDLGHDRHGAEDIAQSLCLARWQVWNAKGNEGWAKHRMSDRAKDETAKLAAELRNEPQPVEPSPKAQQVADGRDDPDPPETYHVESAGSPYRPFRVSSLSRGRPPFGLGRSGGRSGWIYSRSASGRNGLACTSSLTCLLVDQVRARVQQHCTDQETAVLL